MCQAINVFTTWLYIVLSYLVRLSRCSKPMATFKKLPTPPPSQSFLNLFYLPQKGHFHRFFSGLGRGIRIECLLPPFSFRSLTLVCSSFPTDHFATLESQKHRLTFLNNIQFLDRHSSDSNKTCV